MPDEQPLIPEDEDEEIIPEVDQTAPLIEIRSQQYKVWTPTLILSILVAVIGGSLQFGFQIGNMANTKGALGHKFNISTDSTVMSVIVCGGAIGGLFGGLLAGNLADLVGRKRCMMLNNIPMLLGTALMAVAYNEYFFIAGRILTGFATGISTGVVTMYISEISPVLVRGAVGVSHQFMITFGIFIAFLCSINSVLHADPNKLGYKSLYWKLYFAFPVVPALFQIIVLPFCPESPNWLYYNKEREDLARNAISRLRGSPERAVEEMDEMIKTRTAGTDNVMVSYKQLITNPTLRLSLIIGVGLQCAQQLSGINAILNYAPDIFNSAGFKNGEIATMATGGINVLMTFISVPLMDRLGRRTLMVGGLFFMAVSYVGVAVAQSCHGVQETAGFTLTGRGWNCDGKWTGYVSMVTIFTFIISFAIGPGSIPWLIVGELFTANARGKASSICVCVNWLCNLIVSFTYEMLNDALKPYTFFLYFGIVVASFIFTVLFVPETRKKSVEQIRREIEIQASKCPPTIFGVSTRTLVEVS